MIACGELPATVTPLTLNVGRRVLWGCDMSLSTRSPDRWESEVVVVGVRQAKGLLGIGSAVNAAVSAAEKPRPAK